jgi:surface protein
MIKWQKNSLVFNQPIGNWNTTSVTNMNAMFYAAQAFNQPIGNWNTSAVTNMIDMFRAAYVFNQPIVNWNTISVNNMSWMFYGAQSFNQPIGNWNTNAVTNMSYMFLEAIAFNQPIGNWNISSVIDKYVMLDYSHLSVVNYDSTLVDWAAQTVKPNVQLGAVTLKYCNGAAAHTILTSAPNNWSISGDVFNCTALPLNLLYFNAQKQNSKGLLTWVTTNEINVNRFEIERSTDGRNFTALGAVTALGNTSNNTNYQFTDAAPIIGKNYYRLKIIDKDGSFKYTEIRVLNFENGVLYSVYPNPIGSNITITSNGNNASYILTDAVGKLIMTGKINSGSQIINTSSLAVGIYLIAVKEKGAIVFSQKIIKQ